MGCVNAVSKYEESVPKIQNIDRQGKYTLKNLHIHQTLQDGYKPPRI
jgi:hypothetical protein